MASLSSLKTRKPIWFALCWIGIYIALVFVGDLVSGGIGVENSATALILLSLSIGLVLYLRTNNWVDYYGLRGVRHSDLSRVWFYLPLFAIVLLHYVKGIDSGLTSGSVLWVAVLMLGVGFLEELIFRGFLYKAILENSNVMRAVVISGVTFGVGHIVNLARGMSLGEQLVQVALGVVLGIVLALLFTVTGSIVPGIVFHSLLNISANVTRDVNGRTEVFVVAASLVLSAVYAVPLIRHVRRNQPSDVSSGLLFPAAPSS